MGRFVANEHWFLRTGEEHIMNAQMEFSCTVECLGSVHATLGTFPLDAFATMQIGDEDFNNRLAILKKVTIFRCVSLVALIQRYRNEFRGGTSIDTVGHGCICLVGIFRINRHRILCEHLRNFPNILEATLYLSKVKWATNSISLKMARYVRNSVSISCLCFC